MDITDDAHRGQCFTSRYAKAFQGSAANLVSNSAEQALPRGAAADFVLGAPVGSVRTLGGIDDKSLRVLLDNVEPEQCGRRALFARIAPAPTTEAIVEQIIDLLAETAR